MPQAGMPFAGQLGVGGYSSGIGFQPAVIGAPGQIMGSTGLIGGMNTSGYNAGAFNAGGFSSGLSGFGGMGGGFGVDADPITPGNQSQPGVVTPTGPPQIVGNIGMSGVQPTMTNSISYPGVMGTGVGVFPGMATQQSAAYMQQGSIPLQSSIAGGFVGAGSLVDADPLTPGYQSAPGVVTPTGPSRVIGNVNNSQYPGQNCGNCGNCPWWLPALLGLLALGALLGGLYSLLRKKSGNESDEDNEDIDDRDSLTTVRKQTRRQCVNGYRNSRGQCVTCPDGSRWNGRSCSFINTPVETENTKTTVSSVDGETPEGEALSETTPITKT